MFEYRATLLRIIDGDTIHIAIDLGLDITHRVTIRLHGINTPEMNTPEGPEARHYLGRMLAIGRPQLDPIGALLLVRTVKDRREKYGRYLGIIWRAGEDTSTPSINDRLVTAGHAVPYLPGRP